MNNDLPKLAQPAVRALLNVGITNLQQLTEYRESEISQLHGIGQNALKQLREALNSKGLTFNDSQKPKKLTGQEQVEKFLEGLNHPLKPEIEYVRRVILSANEQLSEHIKWNAPSYFINGDDRITFNLHGKDGFRLIFHCGSKVTEHAQGKPLFEDSTHLLEWVAGDRAIVRFRSMDEIEIKKESLKQVINTWIDVTKDI
ncbi:DUF1801 domain-containing protein [Cohnella caldifontis]|uniref:DUF1801 domain-containing protein n=1 Tax=Cohnella caldifontis TaxID=3027471 RepID=UPI0023EDD9E0|nr:DUF1801 domain-containing protein [Cohnella sp. YIM B05605]